MTVLLQRSNKRMHQTWRGQRLALGWHFAHLSGEFPVLCRATQVMRGRYTAEGTGPCTSMTAGLSWYYDSFVSRSRHGRHL
jgi:hypothetical protein